MEIYKQEIDGIIKQFNNNKTDELTDSSINAAKQNIHLV